MEAGFHDENVEQFAHSCISEIENIISVQLKKWGNLIKLYIKMSSTDERKILKPFPLHTLLSSLQIFWINQVGKKVLNLFPYPSTIYSLYISTCQKYMFRWFKIFANHFQIVTYILLEMKLQSTMEKLNSKKFQDLKKKRLCWLSFNRRLFFFEFFSLQYRISKLETILSE